MSRARLRRLALPLLALSAALSASGDAPAAPPKPSFARLDLDVGGRITEVVIKDLDGDKRADLLVIRGREALVYFQSEKGFGKVAHQRFRFHPRTVLFDVGDLDGDGSCEIVLLRAKGIYAYRLRRRGALRLYGLRPRRVVKVPTLFTRPVRKEVRRKPFLRDLDGDKDLDLVVPQRDGFALLANSGKGRFSVPVQLNLPPQAVVNVGQDRLSSQLFASTWFANPNVAQWDATGRPELVLAREGRIHAFTSGARGLPTRLVGAWSIPDQRRFSRMVKNPLELDFTMPLIVADLDGDKRVDVSSTHVGKGLTRVFRNGGDPQKAFSLPAHTFRIKGVTPFSYYVDLDGDGRLDLVLPRLDTISAWTVIKVLISRSVPVDMLVYYQRSNGTFPRQADAQRKLKVPLSMNSAGRNVRFGSSLVATIDGDYDGDGLKDLLYRTGSATLSLFRGLPGRTLEESASVDVDVPNLDEYRFCVPSVADLNGDGRSDVVLRYHSWNRDADRLVVLTAR